MLRIEPHSSLGGSTVAISLNEILFRELSELRIISCYLVAAAMRRRNDKYCVNWTNFRHLINGKRRYKTRRYTAYRHARCTPSSDIFLPIFLRRVSSTPLQGLARRHCATLIFRLTKIVSWHISTAAL